jgi:uncharacterized membrane protein YkvA (DUF1232 family)
LVLLIAYLASLIDLIPDFIPVLGYAEDAIIVAVALRSVIRHAGPDAIERHWPGTRRPAQNPATRRTTTPVPGDSTARARHAVPASVSRACGGGLALNRRPVGRGGTANGPCDLSWAGVSRAGGLRPDESEGTGGWLSPRALGAGDTATG